jgi:lipoprotein-anchoring transpeptidase ErfK/SrfK
LLLAIAFALAGTPAEASSGRGAGPAFWAHATATISISRQELTFVAVTPDYKKIEYRWPVSTGRKGFETPTGRYRPIWADAEHKSSIYEDAPMPFAVFFVGGYAIHGTTELKHLGRPASHGCVRLDPANAEILYNTVNTVGLQHTVITVVD